MFTDKELAEMDVTDEAEVETETAAVVVVEENGVNYTPTTAPMPRQAIEAVAQDWFKTVCQSEDLPEYMSEIPVYHYKALVAKVETALMKNGVFVMDDGRLAENKKRGIKMRR